MDNSQVKHNTGKDNPKRTIRQHKPIPKNSVRNDLNKSLTSDIVKSSINNTYQDKKNKHNKQVKKMPKKNIVPTLEKNDDVKIYSLGGVGVVGMNMYCVEQNDEILIMDAGILFASDDVHGVNYIIPDFTYLIQNAHKIIGLFITHGHEDHIGALPFLLQKVKIPCIYASGLAVGLIENKMAEFENIPYKLETYSDDSEYTFKNFTVSFFRTNHSIPDSFGIAVKTDIGYVVNTGDFKFDFSPIGPSSDYYKMTKLGHLGVACLLAESTNANITQFSSSEKKIGETLLSLFKQIKGRIIVATFASNVYRVQQIIEASVATNRKVVVFGHSMEKTIEVASRLKYLKAPKGFIQKARDLKKIESEDVTILCTGSQGEPLAALSRIAQGTHKQIKIKENDTIIYSSKPIPGNEQFINRNINLLVHSGAHVIKNNPLTDTHTTGHASQNELRMMLTFMRPKYFIPIHGEYAMLKKHVELATGIGIDKNNCFILNPGDVFQMKKNGATVIRNAVPANDVYLDNSLSDVDSSILKDRKKMVDNGLVSITYYINRSNKIINKPIINLKGFVTASASLKIIESLSVKSIDIYNNLTSSKQVLPLASLEKQVSNQINQYFYSKLECKPFVVVDIIKVDIK